MTTVPSGLVPTPITSFPEYAGTSALGYMLYVVDGVTYKVQLQQVVAAINVPSARIIASGTGLTGGGNLSADRTISVLAAGIGDAQLSLTGVAAGTYGDGGNVPQFTVNAQGRITGVSNIPLTVTGYVPTARRVNAGNGLTGGGTLAADITLTVDYSAASPTAPSQTPSAGSSTQLSRGDHVHPSPDLSVLDQTQGVLPLGRGGTGSALSPVAGAVVYSGGSALALTAVGGAGQVLASTGVGTAPVWNTAVGLAAANVFTAAQTINTTGTPVVTPVTNVLFEVQSSGNSAIVQDTFGGFSQFVGRRAQGTPGSPSGVTGNLTLVQLQGRGYGTTGYSTTRGFVGIAASQVWSDSAQGSRIQFGTTPNGSTTPVTSWIIESDGTLLSQSNVAYDFGSTTFRARTGYFGSLDITGTVASTSYLRPGVFTVGTLPSAAAAGQGAKAHVSDSNQTTAAGIGTLVAGGAANSNPVYVDNAPAWRIG